MFKDNYKSLQVV